MIPLLANLFLAFVWATMSGSFSSANLVIGFVVGYIILYFQQQIAAESSYFGKARKVAAFLVFFLSEIIISSVRVAIEILRPADRTRPGIVSIDLEGYTDFEAYALATVVTLTPGSLSLDVRDAPHGKTLYVHAMFVEDPDKFRQELRDGLCRRLMEVLR
ncbi:MAG: Na+/H+ antiporter subunit E [Candidatus Hydrogenedentes bacterium]|nr:Na+/H+ antiporter subunit E [Candidatus Hydrogenedentota bacterium]